MRVSKTLLLILLSSTLSCTIGMHREDAPASDTDSQGETGDDEETAVKQVHDNAFRVKNSHEKWVIKLPENSKRRRHEQLATAESVTSGGTQTASSSATRDLFSAPVPAGSKVPAQLVLGAGRSADEKNSDLEFHKALAQQQRGDSKAALALWDAFLAKYAVSPATEPARYNKALCLFDLARYSETIETLEHMVSSQSFPELTHEARTLRAEALVADHRFDSALAATFELIPDLKAEAEAGLDRNAGVVGTRKNPWGEPSKLQQARLFIVRARAFAGSKQYLRATDSFARARIALTEVEKNPAVKATVQADLARWEVEALGQACKAGHPYPRTLSEDSFLAYAESYFGCVQNAPRLLCEIGRVTTTQESKIFQAALTSYSDLLDYPKGLLKAMPEPSRTFKRPEQRVVFEREMRELVEKTTESKSAPFRDLVDCGLELH